MWELVKVGPLVGLLILVLHAPSYEAKSCDECDTDVLAWDIQKQDIPDDQFVADHCAAANNLYDCYTNCTGSDSNVVTSHQLHENNDKFNFVRVTLDTDCNTACQMAYAITCDHLKCDDTWSDCVEERMASRSCNGSCLSGELWYKALQVQEKINCSLSSATCQQSVISCIAETWAGNDFSYPPIHSKMIWEEYFLTDKPKSLRCRDLQKTAQCFNSSFVALCTGDDATNLTAIRDTYQTTLVDDTCMRTNLCVDEIVAENVPAPTASSDCQVCDNKTTAALGIVAGENSSTDPKQYGDDLCGNLTEARDCYTKAECPYTESVKLVTTHVEASCKSDCRFADFWVCDNIITGDNSCSTDSLSIWSDCENRVASGYKCNHICSSHTRNVRLNKFNKLLRCEAQKINEATSYNCQQVILDCVNTRYSIDPLDFQNFIQLNHSRTAQDICAYMRFGTECLSGEVLSPGAGNLTESCILEEDLSVARMIKSLWEDLYEDNTCKYLESLPTNSNHTFEEFCELQHGNSTNNGNKTTAVVRECVAGFIGENRENPCEANNPHECGEQFVDWNQCVVDHINRTQCHTLCSQAERQSYIDRVLADINCNANTGLCRDVLNRCMQPFAGGREREYALFVTPTDDLQTYCGKLETLVECWINSTNSTNQYFTTSLRHECRSKTDYVTGLVTELQNHKEQICSDTTKTWDNICPPDMLANYTSVLNGHSNEREEPEQEENESECRGNYVTTDENNPCKDFNPSDCSEYQQWETCYNNEIQRSGCTMLCTQPERESFIQMIQYNINCQTQSSYGSLCKDVLTSCMRTLFGGPGEAEYVPFYKPNGTLENYCGKNDDMLTCWMNTTNGTNDYFGISLRTACASGGGPDYVLNLISKLRGLKEQICVNMSHTFDNLCPGEVIETLIPVPTDCHGDFVEGPDNPCSANNPIECGESFTNWESCVRGHINRTGCNTWCSENERQSFVTRLQYDINCRADSRSLCRDILQRCMAVYFGGPGEFQHVPFYRTTDTLSDYCGKVDTMILCFTNTTNGTNDYFGRPMGPQCNSTADYVLELANDLELYKSQLCNDMSKTWDQLCIGETDAEQSTGKPIQSNNCIHSYNTLSGPCGQHNPQSCGDNLEQWIQCVNTSQQEAGCTTFCSKAEREAYLTKLNYGIECNLGIDEDRASLFCKDSLKTICFEGQFGTKSKDFVNPQIPLSEFCGKLENTTACVKNTTNGGSTQYFARALYGVCGTESHTKYVQSIIEELEMYTQTVCSNQSKTWTEVCNIDTGGLEGVRDDGIDSNGRRRCEAISTETPKCNLPDNCHAGSDLTLWRECLNVTYPSCDTLCSLAERQNFVYRMSKEPMCLLFDPSSVLNFCSRAIQDACLGYLQRIGTARTEGTVAQLCSYIDDYKQCVTNTTTNSITTSGYPIQAPCALFMNGINELMDQVNSFIGDLCDDPSKHFVDACPLHYTPNPTDKTKVDSDRCPWTVQGDVVENCDVGAEDKCANLSGLFECYDNAIGPCADSICTRQQRLALIKKTQFDVDCDPVNANERAVFCPRIIRRCLVDNIGDQHTRFLDWDENTHPALICSLLTDYHSCLYKTIDGNSRVPDSALSIDNVCNRTGHTNFVNRQIERIAPHVTEWCAADASIQTICPNGADFGGNEITFTEPFPTDKIVYALTDFSSLSNDCSPCTGSLVNLKTLLHDREFPASVSTSKQFYDKALEQFNHLRTCITDECIDESNYEYYLLLLQKLEHQYFNTECPMAHTFKCEKDLFVRGRPDCDKLQEYKECVQSTMSSFDCDNVCTPATRFSHLARNSLYSHMCNFEGECQAGLVFGCNITQLNYDFVHPKDPRKQDSSHPGDYCQEFREDLKVCGTNLVGGVVIVGTQTYSAPCTDKSTEITQLTESFIPHRQFNLFCDGISNEYTFRDVCGFEIKGRTNVTVTKYKVGVSMKLDADYDTLVGDQRAQVIEDLKIQLAQRLGIPVSKLKNLKISKGSIVIEFDIETEDPTEVEHVDTALSNQTLTVGGEELAVSESNVEPVQKSTTVVDSTQCTYCQELYDNALKYSIENKELLAGEALDLEMDRFKGYVCEEFRVVKACLNECQAGEFDVDSLKHTVELNSNFTCSGECPSILVSYCDNKAQSYLLGGSDECTTDNKAKFERCVKEVNTHNCIDECKIRESLHYSIQYIERSAKCISADGDCKAALEACYENDDFTATTMLQSAPFNDESATVEEICTKMNVFYDCIESTKQSGCPEQTQEELTQLAKNWRDRYNHEEFCAEKNYKLTYNGYCSDPTTTDPKTTDPTGGTPTAPPVVGPSVEGTTDSAAPYYRIESVLLLLVIVCCFF